MTEHEQLTLVRERIRRSKPPAAPGAAEELPVARVLVSTPHPHLDRPFDYLVSADQSAACVPGCRVKVRFAGKEVDGYVIERVGSSGHPGRLAPLRRVVSSEAVLTPAVQRLCRDVAERYAGTTHDVLRLAVPKRHARVEQEPPQPRAHPAVVAPGSQAWSSVSGGQAFVDRLEHGESPRAVWTACPGVPWEQALLESAAATVRSGRGVLVCLPDARDVTRLVEVLRAGGLGSRTTALTADLGPAPRYRAFLRVLRGDASIVAGTRAAAFAPVQRLGLLVVWDDGDDLHAEQRAPYPHVREVLTQRAYVERAAVLVGGFARTAEGAALVRSGWAESLAPAREAVRAGAPRVHVAGESDTEQLRDPAARGARLPPRAFQVAREALAEGPVLVQVPRGGYLPTLSCVRCRQPARCRHCHGPLALRGPRHTAGCGWCGRAAADWRCEHCGADRFRAPVVGSERTAEEVGRAFPSVPVVSSAAGRVQARVGGGPALVVSTPGAEPVADGGYAAALLLDSWVALSRPGLRTPEEALRRWLNAAALVRPAGQGGRVVVVGDPAVPVLQALVRWDASGAADRELAERASAHLPPAARLALVSGPAEEVTAVLDTLELPAGGEVLGPLPLDADDGQLGGRAQLGDRAQLVARVPRDRGAALSTALKQLQASRSARKLPHLRVHVDPVELA
ncbi:MAG TPA: primosomal protein N' [Nocardioidaceae bacterium]|nr:primosomal protein N' [Nocardioidaceae bacterium]